MDTNIYLNWNEVCYLIQLLRQDESKTDKKELNKELGDKLWNLYNDMAIDRWQNKKIAYQKL